MNLSDIRISISFDLEEYCKNCPSLKADVKTTEFYADNMPYTDMAISCEYKDQCGQIHAYLNTHADLKGHPHTPTETQTMTKEEHKRAHTFKSGWGS